MTPKNILLTFDYEIYFGSCSGTFKDCIEKPVQAILEVLREFNIKATFFVDILHYWRLETLGRVREAKQIKRNIQSILDEDHDVQLHIHSHWIHTKERGDGGWDFAEEYYRLHDLPSSSDDNPAIETLEGCVIHTKELLQDICQEVNSDHNIFAFRAGGWRLQPFHKLRQSFLRAGLRVDSSVLPGCRYPNVAPAFNFEDAPRLGSWRFSDNELVVDPEGPFTEIPIASHRPLNIAALSYRMLRMICGGDWCSWGHGQPMGGKNNKNKHAARMKKAKIIGLPFARTVFRYPNFETLTHYENEWVIRKYLEYIGCLGPIVTLSHPKGMSPAAMVNMRAFIKKYIDHTSFETFTEYAG